MKLLLLPLTLLVLAPFLAGCSGETEPDAKAIESMNEQRGPARPGGAPPGFPVPGTQGK